MTSSAIVAMNSESFDQMLARSWIVRAAIDFKPLVKTEPRGIQEITVEVYGREIDTDQNKAYPGVRYTCRFPSQSPNDVIGFDDRFLSSDTNSRYGQINQTLARWQEEVSPWLGTESEIACVRLTDHTWKRISMSNRRILRAFAHLQSALAYELRLNDSGCQDFAPRSFKESKEVGNHRTANYWLYGKYYSIDGLVSRLLSP